MESHLSIYPRSEDVEIPSKEEVDKELDSVFAQDATMEYERVHKEGELLNDELELIKKQISDVAQEKEVEELEATHVLIGKKIKIENAIRYNRERLSELSNKINQSSTGIRNDEELAIIQESLGKAFSQESLAVVDALTNSKPKDPRSQIILPFAAKEVQ